MTRYSPEPMNGNMPKVIALRHFLKLQKSAEEVGNIVGTFALQRYSHASYIITNILSLQHKQQTMKFSHSKLF